MQAAVPDMLPIGEINTTPLVDVMLVLLVMFIITVPLQSHVVKIDLPHGTPPLEHSSVRNTLVVAQGGGLLWNGQPASDDHVRATLLATQRAVPVPELHLRPDAAAPYHRVDEILVMAKRAQVERMGFVGNEAYRRF